MLTTTLTVLLFFSSPANVADAQVTPPSPSSSTQPRNPGDLQRYEFSSPQMGTRFRIVMYAGNPTLAGEAADAAFQRASELNRIMSDYLPESELSRLSESSGSGRYVPVSSELFDVLAAATDFSRLSGGAFDITAGPYTRLWRSLRDDPNPMLPSGELLTRLSGAVGYGHLTLNESAQSVRLEKEEMLLDLGGIAKGYAGDEMLKVLRSYGITAALIDAGGDLVLGDSPPDRGGWRIRLPLTLPMAAALENAPASSLQPLFPASESDAENPDENVTELILSNCAVATSGDLFQFVEIDGVRYSHIIDPATGLGLTEQRRVTVIAPDGMTADALSSAVSVLGPGKRLQLLNDLPETEGIIIWLDGDQYHRMTTAGFRNYIVSGTVR